MSECNDIGRGEPCRGERDMCRGDMCRGDESCMIDDKERCKKGKKLEKTGKKGIWKTF